MAGWQRTLAQDFADLLRAFIAHEVRFLLIGAYALVASSIFMSVMFPTIFALGLEGLGDDERKLGSSLIVMAIIGGAILTALMGAVSDQAGIHWAMAIPALCFAVILWFAFASQRRPTAVGT